MGMPDKVAEAVSRFSAVFAEDEFRAELGRLFRFPEHSEVPREISTKVLKAHATRCTFEVAVNIGTTWHSVIGKIHSVDRSDIFAAMQSISRAGFGPDAEFGIPQPLGYLPTSHVLFEEKVHGTPAKDAFLKGDPAEQVAAARRCGTWLARFHALAPRQGPIDEPATLRDRLRHWTDQIKDHGEPLATKSESLFRKLEASLPAAGTFERCAGHGSYVPEQVFFSGPRTVVIDLDEHDVADPARDAAWFVVSLHRLGLTNKGSLRAHEAAIEAFLDAYRAAGRRDALAHLSFYKAAECLHRARRDVRRRTPPVPEWAEIMLDEGLRTL